MPTGRDYFIESEFIETNFMIASKQSKVFPRPGKRFCIERDRKVEFLEVFTLVSGMTAVMGLESRDITVFPTKIFSENFFGALRVSLGIGRCRILRDVVDVFELEVGNVLDAVGEVEGLVDAG